MDDLISRQQAIDKIKQRLFETAFNNVGIKQNIDETLVDVAENRLETWFDEQPTIEPEQRWIPVTERLPEIDKEVLVTDGELCWVCSLFESPDIEDGLYQWEDNYGHWHEFETWVAWMPLPPYRGGEQDG